MTDILSEGKTVQGESGVTFCSKKQRIFQELMANGYGKRT